MEPIAGLRLPAQAAVSRELMPGQGYVNTAGIEAAQTVCDNLTGLAQQMCYAVEYGVSI
jgi:hypothetical protein